MPTQDQIETAIAEIVPGGKFPASKLNPLLSDMLSFSSELDVYDGMTADGTTALNTKLTLIYGVNEITTSSLTNYACKLPKPVTGRRLTVVNRSLFALNVYPSNPGGVIYNNAIDAPVIVPPDGKPYIFTCVENPLPGAWVWTAPAIGQWDSGEITSTTTLSTSYLYASSPAFVAERAGLYSTNYSFNGLNQAPFPNPGTPSAMPNQFWSPAFKPTTNWSGIAKVKVYTNISSNGILDVPQALIWASQQYNTYQAGTTTWIIDGIATSPQLYFKENPTLNNGFSLNNIVPGVVPAPGVTTNIGDPGTIWGEISVATSQYSGTLFTTTIGDVFVSTNGIEDIWLTTLLGLGLKPRIIAAGIKFRFFIEYM